MSDGGKGDDRRPAAERDLYQRGHVQIDWTARAREQAARDAVTTGYGFLEINADARVESNQVNAIDPVTAMSTETELYDGWAQLKHDMGQHELQGIDAERPPSWSDTPRLFLGEERHAASVERANACDFHTPGCPALRDTGACTCTFGVFAIDQDLP